MKFFKSPLFTIVFTIFLDALGFAILIPIIPLLLADPTSNFFILPQNLNVSTGYVLLGLITAVFPLTQLFSSSILGQFSDKIGRKPILQNTLFLTSLSYLLFAVGIAFRNIPLLFISRALAGISSGNISVAQAAIADITKPEDRAKNFGFIGAAFGLGFIIGPFLGGLLSDPSIFHLFNPTVPFLFAAALSLVNAFQVRKFLKETNLHINRQRVISWSKSLLDIQKAFQLKNVRFLFFINFLFMSGFTFFVTFMSIFLIEKFGWNQSSVGNFFSFFGIWFLVTQSVITGLVAKRLREAQVLRICLLGAGITIGAMYLIPNETLLFIAVPFQALFMGLVFSNLGALISRSVDAQIQGEILGINASVVALAQLIPPIASGFIAAAFSSETPVIIATTIVLISGIMFLFYKAPKEIAHIKNY